MEKEDIVIDKISDTPEKSCIIVIKHLFPWSESELDAKRLDELNHCFEDAFLEAASYGCVKEMCIVGNSNPELKGNVYIEYETWEEAALALERIAEKNYGAKVVKVYSTDIKSLTAMRCEGFEHKQCEKSETCEKFHVLPPAPGLKKGV
eukprot:gnl/Carplike_NY0171/3196_a4299_405.p1 GENE.gnl/Carplike_NY0171/3196_a4299_405~~gnl/Carplike_NY0171/3196_a4299_405.p1  ORF type:complete len:149 (-),score=19.77 gnl/Carplike_NY0171/3196_a4299_405:2-448(-)